MSMVDTGLAWDHHLRYLGNHSLDIQMILGVQRGILHFVDIPVQDEGVLLGVHQDILSILEVMDICILLGLGVVGEPEVVDCWVGVLHPGVEVWHCNHGLVQGVLGVLKNGVQGVLGDLVNLEDPMGPMKMGVLLGQHLGQAVQLEEHDQVAVIDSEGSGSNPQQRLDTSNFCVDSIGIELFRCAFQRFDTQKLS